MKILHLSSEKGWRGGERQVILLLKELQKNEIQCKLLCHSSSKLYEVAKSENVIVNAFNFRSPFNLKAAFQVKKIVLKENFDLVHVHSSKAHTLTLLSTLIGLKVPIILTKRTTFKIKRNPLTLYKYNHESLKCIIAISEKIRSQIGEVLKNKDKVHVVYSGIDINQYQPNDTGILHHLLGLPDSILIIGIVAALSLEKDHFTFIRAAKILLKRHPDLHFAIIGKGPLEKELRRNILASKLQDHVHIVGYRTDIHNILPELDVMMLTSVVEGLGSVILDAFGSKTPVVATRTGGIPELVKHGETGLLAEIKDAEGLARNVEKILSDFNLRNNIIDNASRFLGDFSKEKMAKKTIAIYREALGP